jgi:hypothetical protein
MNIAPSVENSPTTHFDVINADTLTLQQESKFGFIYPPKSSLKVFFSVPIGVLRKHHQRSIRSLKPHVQHPLGFYAVGGETLSLKFRSDI